MIRKIAILSFCSLIFLASCRNASLENKKSADDRSEAITQSEMEPPPPPPSPEEEKSSISSASNNIAITSDESAAGNADKETEIKNPVVKIAEKIKKTANIDIVVDDYKKARAAIDGIVKSNNAYIGGENEQNSTYNITNNMVIRVANKDFDKVVASLTGVASHVNSKNSYMEDVTAQFVDITARLKTKKEVEKRYLDLLQKAVKVSDILEVEEQLRVIREEIEAKEGELKYLNDQVDYSTINLNFHQDFEYTPQDEPGFFGRAGTAFGNGWNGFLSFLVALVYAWPLWVILASVAYFTVRFIKRKILKK
ncbi:MAG: DUF4349 domain-containing protein [Bacteroidia bacterium]